MRLCGKRPDNFTLLIDLAWPEILLGGSAATSCAGVCIAGRHMLFVQTLMAMLHEPAGCGRITSHAQDHQPSLAGSTVLPARCQASSAGLLCGAVRPRFAAGHGVSQRLAEVA